MPASRSSGEISCAAPTGGSFAGVRHRFHLDIVTARLADRLLVLTGATLSPPRKARDVAVRIAERAVAKLRGLAPIG